MTAITAFSREAIQKGTIVSSMTKVEKRPECQDSGIYFDKKMKEALYG